MRRFVEGTDRGQSTLFPECLEDWIGEDNPVRVIDVFVDELDLAEDVYVCPAGQRLAYSFTTEDKGLVLRRYWTNACQSCAIKHSCTTGKERLISRWEHEHILEAVQRRLDEHPEKMRQRRETVEHPFGTIKARMGATHFLMKTLPRVATEMALHVLAYNLTRVMNIIGVQPLMVAMRA
jgi:hypothetical protein